MSMPSLIQQFQAPATTSSAPTSSSSAPAAAAPVATSITGSTEVKQNDTTKTTTTTRTSTSTRPTSTSPQESATRKEIRQLTDQEIYRLCIAIQAMQKATDTEGKITAWGKIAGIHGGGIPADTDVKLQFRNIFWCPHHQIQFPIWHRCYLAEFEYMLQTYDMDPSVTTTDRYTSKNRLMLPFWDWSGGELFPSSIPPVVASPTLTLKIIDPVTKQPKTVTFDPNPLASGPARPVGKDPPRRTRRRGTEKVTTELFNRNVISQVHESLAEPNFNVFACSINGAYSIENPHDSVHVSVGGDMIQVNTSAFDPIFWMHHCNIDRLWNSWELIHASDTNRIYLNDSDMNLPLEPFHPWILDTDGTLKHVFPWQYQGTEHPLVKDWANHDACPIKYTYSYFPPAPIPRGISMRERRMLVVIRNVPTPPKSIDIFVYLKKRIHADSTIDMSDHIFTPAELDDDCAGIISLFAFNTTNNDEVDYIGCVSCQQREPLTYSLDVTDFAGYLGIKNPMQGIISTIAFFVQDVDDNTNNNDRIWQEPSITDNVEFIWEDEYYQDDTHRIQKHVRYLQYYGYMSRHITYEQALQTYIQRWRPSTSNLHQHELDQLMKIPRSGNPDGLHDIPIKILVNQIYQHIIQTISTTTTPTTTPLSIDINFQWALTHVDTELLPYFIIDPQHRRNSQTQIAPSVPTLVQHLSTYAFQSWTNAFHTTPLTVRNVPIILNVSFSYVVNPANADIEITWRPMDAPGRTIGYATMESSHCVIALDTSEQWVLSSLNNTSVALDDVIRHELGHCFGLQHDIMDNDFGTTSASHHDSIMYPYMDGHQRQPTTNDIQLIINSLKLS